MNGTAARWLWTRTEGKHSRYWSCEGCEAHGNLVAGDDAATRDHVTSTGHTVHIYGIYSITLEGVSTDGGPDHV